MSCRISTGSKVLSPQPVLVYVEATMSNIYALKGGTILNTDSAIWMYLKNRVRTAMGPVVIPQLIK